MNVTDRRQTDGRPMTYSEHELEFTFAKNVLLGVLLDTSVSVQRNVSFANETRRSNNNNNVRLLQLQSERYNRTNICHAGQH